MTLVHRDPSPHPELDPFLERLQVPLVQLAQQRAEPPSAVRAMPQVRVVRPVSRGRRVALATATAATPRQLPISRSPRSPGTTAVPRFKLIPL